MRGRETSSSYVEKNFVSMKEKHRVGKMRERIVGKNFDIPTRPIEYSRLVYAKENYLIYLEEKDVCFATLLFSCKEHFNLRNSRFT